jgi:hypothetical protein
MKEFAFKAVIQAGMGGGAGVIFPFDVEKELGTRGKIPVKATFDGVPYAGSLVKYGDASHMLGVLKSIRAQIGKGPGDTIDVVVWRDEQTRNVEVPAEFAAAMKEAGVAEFFESLSYTHRKEYCRWICEAKKQATRKNRVTKGVEMLKKGVKTPG